jgi:hypothetical protein
MSFCVGYNLLGNATLPIDSGTYPAGAAHTANVPLARAVRQRTWLPVARWQPILAMTLSTHGTSRSFVAQTGNEARFSWSGHELLRSDIREARPRQELPGRCNNVPDLTTNASDRRSAYSNPGRSSPDLKSTGSNPKSPGSDLATNFPVRARSSPVWQEGQPIWPLLDPA